MLGVIPLRLGAGSFDSGGEGSGRSRDGRECGDSRRPQGASGSIRREGLRNGRRRGREQERRGLPKKIGRQRLIPVFGEMRGKSGRGKRCVCGTGAMREGTGRGRERRAGRKARERRGGACAPEQEITPGRGVSPRANRISGSRNLYPQRCCAGCRGQDLRNMGECRRGMPRESFEFRRRQGLL